MSSANHVDNGAVGQAAQGSGSASNAEGSNTTAGSEDIPRPKRIACILCRKRKLKCDGSKPSCATCSRLGHKCEYSEERKKSGPKRGYVKLLEARLKQVENLLETLDTPAAAAGSSNGSSSAAVAQLPLPPTQGGGGGPANEELPMAAGNVARSVDNVAGNVAPLASRQMDSSIDSAMDTSMEGLGPDAFIDTNLNPLPDFGLNGTDAFSWDMVSLGLEEPLPDQATIDELNSLYFEKVHPSMPMIHRGRFLVSMDLAPQLRPCVALRYIMWAHAASVSSNYGASAEHFYARARKYMEQDEMRGHGESIVTVAHCQAWNLICSYEFKNIYFPRAWMSAGRSSRLALMLGLHRQDRVGLDVKQTLAPPRDWIDREERRRTFWVAFCQDRYASIGTGWPMELDERDILTNLPASDESFSTGTPEPTLQLSDLINGEITDRLSSHAGIVLLAAIYGRNLTHLHRPNDSDNDHDLNGEFWKRHRNLDNLLLNIALSMPASLRLPAAIGDSKAVFCNMSLHTATICLHQAAIFKAEKNRLPAQISAESKRRCIVAADQVANIMKMISHVDLSSTNPFLAFCLYVSARVFVQYLKSRREDSAVMSSLDFLLSAMQVLKTKNPLTESFLVQLDVDIEGSGIDLPSNYRPNSTGRRVPAEVPVNTDSVRCSPLFEIRESQAVGQTSREHGGESTCQSNTSEPNCVVSRMTAVTFDGSNILYSAPVAAQLTGNSTSTASQSNLPTPASSSNRRGSHPLNSFSPLSSSSTNSKDLASSVNTNSNTTSASTLPPTWAKLPDLTTGTRQQRANPGAGDDDGFPFPSAAAGPGAGREGEAAAAAAAAPISGLTPLPDSDTLWQSVMEAEDDWLQGWPGA